MDVLESSVTDLTPREIVAALQAAGTLLDERVVEERLKKLRKWGAVSPRTDTSRILRHSDLLARHWRYTATPTGRQAQRFYRTVLAGTPAVREIFDRYGIGDAIVALFCLACGLVRTVGRGDPQWLHNLDDDGQEHGHASIPADEADAFIGEKILERLDSEPDLIRRAQQAADMGDLDRELAAELAELAANQHTLEAALAASRTTWPVLSDDAKRLVLLYLIRRVMVGEPWLPLEQQIQITWRL